MDWLPLGRETAAGRHGQPDCYDLFFRTCGDVAGDTLVGLNHWFSFPLRAP